jgi:uncharacterized protein (TIGR03118 family)
VLRAVVAVAAAALVLAGSSGGAATNSFAVRVLVSDGDAPAASFDERLVNPWGLAASATGPWWTGNDMTDTSTIYNGDGVRQSLVVPVVGGPTGVVANSTSGFAVSNGAGTAPARFIFACEDGRIRAWASSAGGAQVVADLSHLGAVLRGMTMAGDRLYVADFHGDRVFVFDSSWQQITRRGAFVDPKIPRWYTPFGIQAIGDRIFVTYAWPAPVNGDDGLVNGYVDVFDRDGKLLSRVGRNGPLNSPWGIALAPPSFGKFGGDLLVGNWGDGHISVYRERAAGKWAFLGQLRTPDQKPIVIDSLWSLQFGNGASAGSKDALYFTAGPKHAAHGLFGSIIPAP